MRLSDKRALVTGGAQGIGHAVAETFGREGAIVYIADVDGRPAQQPKQNCAGRAPGQPAQRLAGGRLAAGH